MTKKYNIKWRIFHAVSRWVVGWLDLIDALSTVFSLGFYRSWCGFWLLCKITNFETAQYRKHHKNVWSQNG